MPLLAKLQSSGILCPQRGKCSLYLLMKNDMEFNRFYLNNSFCASGKTNLSTVSFCSAQKMGAS
jgi:hypothetical protein